MKVDVAYICVTDGPGTLHRITRFVATHHAFQAGAEHRLVPIFNGAINSDGNTVAIHENLTNPFMSLNHSFFNRTNEGWDIGGYREAAHTVCKDADIMVCFGESVYFHRAGWLEHLVKAWEKFGPGMYGTLASFILRPHIQTTAFVTSPELLRKFPRKISTKDDRYEFEHGRHSFMSWLKLQQMPVKLVTFDGVYDEPMWRMPQNIIWKGDQSNCLVWCNHTDHYTHLTPTAKRNWQQVADRRR
jgi:hypothetical protein